MPHSHNTGKLSFIASHDKYRLVGLFLAHSTIARDVVCPGASCDVWLMNHSVVHAITKRFLCWQTIDPEWCKRILRQARRGLFPVSLFVCFFFCFCVGIKPSTLTMTRQGPKTLVKAKPQQQNSEGRQIFSRPG